MKKSMSCATHSGAVHLAFRGSMRPLQETSDTDPSAFARLTARCRSTTSAFACIKVCGLLHHPRVQDLLREYRGRSETSHHMLLARRVTAAIAGGSAAAAGVALKARILLPSLWGKGAQVTAATVEARSRAAQTPLRTTSAWYRALSTSACSSRGLTAHAESSRISLAFVGGGGGSRHFQGEVQVREGGPPPYLSGPGSGARGGSKTCIETPSRSSILASWFIGSSNQVRAQHWV